MKNQNKIEMNLTNQTTQSDEIETTFECSNSSCTFLSAFNMDSVELLNTAKNDLALFVELFGKREDFKNIHQIANHLAKTSFQFLKENENKENNSFTLLSIKNLYSNHWFSLKLNEKKQLEENLFTLLSPFVLCKPKLADYSTAVFSLFHLVLKEVKEEVVFVFQKQTKIASGLLKNNNSVINLDDYLNQLLDFSQLEKDLVNLFLDNIQPEILAQKLIPLNHLETPKKWDFQQYCDLGLFTPNNNLGNQFVENTFFQTLLSKNLLNKPDNQKDELTNKIKEKLNVFFEHLLKTNDLKKILSYSFFFHFKNKVYLIEKESFALINSDLVHKLRLYQDFNLDVKNNKNNDNKTISVEEDPIFNYLFQNLKELYNFTYYSILNEEEIIQNINKILPLVEVVEQEVLKNDFETEKEKQSKEELLKFFYLLKLNSLDYFQDNIIFYENLLKQHSFSQKYVFKIFDTLKQYGVYTEREEKIFKVINENQKLIKNLFLEFAEVIGKNKITGDVKKFLKETFFMKDLYTLISPTILFALECIEKYDFEEIKNLKFKLDDLNLEKDFLDSLHANKTWFLDFIENYSNKKQHKNYFSNQVLVELEKTNNKSLNETYIEFFVQKSFFEFFLFLECFDTNFVTKSDFEKVNLDYIEKTNKDMISYLDSQKIFNLTGFFLYLKKKANLVFNILSFDLLKVIEDKNKENSFTNYGLLFVLFNNFHKTMKKQEIHKTQV